MAYEMFPPRRRLCFNKNINNVNTQPWSTGQLSWLWTRHTQMGINMDMGSSFWLPRALPEFMQKYVFFCAGHFSHNNQSKIKWHSKRRSPAVHKKKTRKIVILNCYRRRAGGNCGQFVIRSFMCELLWEHWNLVDGGLADH